MEVDVSDVEIGWQNSETLHINEAELRCPFKTLGKTKTNQQYIISQSPGEGTPCPVCIVLLFEQLKDVNQKRFGTLPRPD